MPEDAEVHRCFATEYVTARQRLLDQAEKMELERSNRFRSQKRALTKKRYRQIISGLGPKMQRN